MNAMPTPSTAMTPDSDITTQQPALSQQPTLPEGRPARRFIADQIREARSIILKAQSDVRAEQQAQDDEGDKDVDKARPGYRALYDPKVLEEKLAWAEGLSSDAGTTLNKAFKRLEQQGVYRRVAEAPLADILDELDQDFPNFGAVTGMIRRRLHLCRMAPEKLLKLPPILLDGPPGVGKTAFCLRLAAALKIRFEQIDISSGGVDFAMAGLDSGYATGRPGRVWESLTHESMSVLWLLDEVEKGSHSTKDSSVSYLLALLEPVTSKQFTDNATQLPIDASWICYIATCNDKTQLDAPLLSRFDVFDIAPPDAGQMRAVVRSIHADMHRREDWASVFESQLSEVILTSLSASTPRDIKRRLLEGYAEAASQQRTHLLDKDIPPASQGAQVALRRIGFV